MRLFAFIITTSLLAASAHLGAASLSPASNEKPWPPPPGVVIASSFDPEAAYIGSPCILVLPDGSYLASHDFFGWRVHHKAPRPAWDRLACIYRSSDKGATWTKIAEVPEMTWGTLFLHQGKVYILGMTMEYGHLVIRRSEDGGHTWTTPIDDKTGRLRTGRYHSSAVPVVTHGGRIWRAVETYTGDGSWSGRFFGATVISAAIEADLLDASSWTETNAIMFDGDWIKGSRTGWLEGNVVVAPEGRIVNILRVRPTPTFDIPYALDGPAAGVPRHEVAAVMDVSPDGETADFDPARGFFQLPGSQSKFTIRHDPVSGRYWSLVQKITNPYTAYHPDYDPGAQRNVLLLISSADLREWTEHYKVLRWNDGLPISRKERVGFQYVDWQFDGEDIVAVSRTAWNGRNFHDANYMTFHRVAGFRKLRMEDSPPDLADRLPEKP